MDTSGEIVDVSGGLVDTSGETLDVSGGLVDISGETLDLSGGTFVDPMIAVQPTPPPPIRMEDILYSTQLLVIQETSDKNLLESIGTISYDVLKPRLIQWAVSGFRNAYTIHEIAISAPPLCSDGQTRSLSDYIEFVSGKTIGDHVAALQARLPDMVVSYAYSGSTIMIVVSKRD